VGLFEKPEFEPNCELNDNDGLYYCDPVLREGDKVYTAHVVVMPTKTGDFVFKKTTGSDKVLVHLQKHFEKFKLKK